MSIFTALSHDLILSCQGKNSAQVNNVGGNGNHSDLRPQLFRGTRGLGSTQTTSQPTGSLASSTDGCYSSREGDPTPTGCLATCSAHTQGKIKKTTTRDYCNHWGALQKKAFFLHIPFSQSTREFAKCQDGFSGQWFPVKCSVNLNHHQLFSLFYRHDKWVAGARSPPLSECGKKQ